MNVENRSKVTTISILFVLITSTWLSVISPPDSNQIPLNFDETSSSSGGARHLYTFADGSSEAIALYQMGTPARNIQVAMPKGAEVTSASVTISGASATGWNSVTDTSRSDWEDGTSTYTETRGESITLAMEDSEEWFVPHDQSSTSTSASAWYDNATYSIRQPHTTNVSESRFSAQRSLSSGTMATYNGAVFHYRNMLFASTWDSGDIKNSVKILYHSNASQMTTGANNQPLKPNLDIGTCTIPALPNSWQYYGWRDWAVTDDERVFGILSSYRGSNAVQYHRIVEWDIRHPLQWTCISSYDVSGGGFGDYTAISYDRTRDSIWVNHNVRKTLVQYDFDGAGNYERNSTDFYTYFMSNGQVRGMSVHAGLFYFRNYQSWNSDALECYAITGDVGSTLTKQQSIVTIPANGYGMHYDGNRFNTLDHYSWTQGQRYREYGTGLTYLITAQPGTSTWVSDVHETEEPVVSANMEVAWSTTAAGDRVEYWISSDNGTHWSSVSNNETVHFSHPGTQIKWKVQLVGTTAVSWWTSIEYASSYAALGEWESPMLPTGTQVGHMRAQWSSIEPTGTGVGVMVSNDDGQNWIWAENNVDIDWGTNVGNKLVYKVSLNTTDNTITPSLESLTMHYEEGYPSSVKIDVGDDGAYEYIGSGGLQDPVIVNDPSIADSLNLHIPQNGEGTVNITFTISAGSPGRVKLSDLDITYRYRTRVLNSVVEGGLVVPDGNDRILVTQIAIGDDASSLNRVDLELQSSHGSDPIMRWTAGNTCTEVSDSDDFIQFDTGNCTLVDIGNDIVSVRMPFQSNWAWDDEVSAEANVTVHDDLGLIVNGWETESLNLRVENDIQLLELIAVEESGRELLPYDWMRGGQNITFSGAIVFEGTSLSPPAGQFNLEVTGQNLSQDGNPIEAETPFVVEANPAHGQYYLTFETPLQSSQGGMLFQVKAVSLPNGSNYINPNFNVMRIVLDGNSPLVLSASPEDGMELHAGTQSISIVVEDSVDPPIEITMHYWVESQDDLNYNTLPDADEYRTSILRSPEILSGGINVFNGIIDDTFNDHGEKVSFYVSGQDQQGNTLARGGGPVCPGFPQTCGYNSGAVPPDWNADLSSYSIREEFPPTLESFNSTILGHDDELPLHPGTEYIARLLVGDENGWQDIQSVHLSLIEDFDDERATIWANFTRPEEGHDMHLESGSTAVAVSNLYSSWATEPTNQSILYLDIRFQLTWLFPEEFDTNGESTFVPIVKVIDWPCDLNSDTPCHEDTGGLGYDEWSLDNDLHFDMVPGHFTATDLATGHNLYRPGESPELIAAGQVVRIDGRILFSEDAAPAPEGAFDIVVGDLERSWSAVPREGGEFTLDILVPNVRSGGLDLYAQLENLPGLADDVTMQAPHIQLIVDGEPPEIRSISPDGDIALDGVDLLPISLHVADGHGFDSERPAEIHWKVRAGTSEISRGNQPFQSGSPIGLDWSWEGYIDLTDAGSIELLPGYMVDIWITGSDTAGNPYLAENNTEHTPLTELRIVRYGPEINLASNSTEISWDNPSPVGGEIAILQASGTNSVTQSGEITFVLLEEISTNLWIEVEDVSQTMVIDEDAPWTISLEVPTQSVEDEEIHRYQLIARDGHVDIDWVSIEPLLVKPHVARDGEALSNQIDDSTGLFVLYIIAIASLCFGVAMLVLYRREKISGMDEEFEQAEQTDLVDQDDVNTVAPPPGFNSMPPPQIQTIPPPVQQPAPVATQSSEWSDAQLLAAGWTQAQVSAHRAKEAGAMGTDLQYNDSVVNRVMEKYGLTDKAKFLAYAEFFDADGNKYLKKEELEAAAKELRNPGGVF
ncbi:MAG: hypothetical protein QGF94_00145 [Candidatus Thalassarchaeaceae archaeon]|jgi:hypothetical protein|nr:hypothetical protein [Candidatus Thalassarchaeaceae archaeon]